MFSRQIVSRERQIHIFAYDADVDAGSAGLTVVAVDTVPVSSAAAAHAAKDGVIAPIEGLRKVRERFFQFIDAARAYEAALDGGTVQSILQALVDAERAFQLR